MRARLHIKTPPGQARGTEKKLRGFLLGFHTPVDTGVLDDEFYWELELNANQWVALNKRVFLFQNFATQVTNMKLVQKAALRMGAQAGDMDTVRTMFRNGTSVTLVKAEEADEDIDGRTRWERFKDRFKRDP